MEPCPICEGDNAEHVLSLQDQPLLVGVMWPDEESATSCERGDIDLTFCPDCGYLWNRSFDPERIVYDQEYDNSLHFSAIFNAYSEELASRLVETYQLHEKTVIDIGCGKGDFLAMLCEAGDNTGYGFDPSFAGPHVTTPGAGQITWSNAKYSEKQAAVQADLVVSRFVFEHIPDPRHFLRMIRRSIADPPRTTIFFEVPDADLIIRQNSIWDLTYEHCSYFSKETLTRSFAACGFKVLRIEQTFGKQFLNIEARVASDGVGDPGSDTGSLEKLRADLAIFRVVQATQIAKWRAKLETWQAQGRSVVAWGAGAKTIGFLNVLRDSHVVSHAVDINPNKQGKYLPGTGQKILPPDYLISDPPEIVLLLNPVYRDEVAAHLAECGLAPEIVTV